MLFLRNWHRSVALQNSVQNGLTWWKSSCHEVASEFFATNSTDPPHWTANWYFGAFRTIWMHSGPFGCLTKLDAKRAKWCKSSCHEVVSEFFATNAPDPAYWTLNSCFGEFCTIWVHLVPFGYLTKLGAKRAGVVQNFVLRAMKSCRNFSQQTTRSTPLDPNLIFHCISYYFWCIWDSLLRYNTQFKTG